MNLASNMNRPKTLKDKEQQYLQQHAAQPIPMSRPLASCTPDLIDASGTRIFLHSRDQDDAENCTFHPTTCPYDMKSRSYVPVGRSSGFGDEGNERDLASDAVGAPLTAASVYDRLAYDRKMFYERQKKIKAAQEAASVPSFRPAVKPPIQDDIRRVAGGRPCSGASLRGCCWPALTACVRGFKSAKKSLRVGSPPRQYSKIVPRAPQRANHASALKIACKLSSTTMR